MLLISVSRQANHQELIKFIRKVLPKAPISYIYKLFRKKDIKVDGKPKKPEYILNFGEEIKIFITDKQAEEFGFRKLLDNDKGIDKKDLSNIEILYEDENVLFINKPVGLLSQKSHSTDVSLNDILTDYIGCTNDFRPSITNRLDRNTSGIVAVGKTYVGLRELSRIFREKAVRKFYHTIVEGRIIQDIKLDNYIIRDNCVSSISNIPIEKSVKVRTDIYPIKVLENYTVCKVELFTGKTHQIRAHFASIGHPIVGDVKYGAKTRYKNHILHCSEMIFKNNEELGFVDFCIKSPPESNKLYADFIRRY